MVKTHEVHDVLKKHTIGDGLSIVADLQRSRGSWLVDELSGRMYLDCYSQFASQPVGWNHPGVRAEWTRLAAAAQCKIANSDLYCTEYARFVQQFARITEDFSHYFFICGGTLGVENALKAAFDWKAQLLGLKDEDEVNHLDVIHLQEAFHGRSGYTLSLTNTLPIKTKWFPKFPWTRIINPATNKYGTAPALVGPYEVEALEKAEQALRKNNVAAIILEPIQGEGGDNHFRPEFLQGLRSLADKYEAMLILDEVQTGVGLTGKMWAYQHFDIVPDMICFGKKTQVCGFCATDRIDEVPNNVFKVSSRINSTWGGNVVDMVRFSIYLQIIEDHKLVDNAAKVGEYFLERLRGVQCPGIHNVRGRGLMIAFDVEDRPKVMQRLSENMLALKCGHNSIRLRPHLDFTMEDVDRAVEFISIATS
jgi:L-lysine 6-transaminase